MLGKKEEPGTPETKLVPSPPSEVKPPEKDTSSIYVTDDLLSAEIEGFVFKWIEIPGEDIIKLTKQMKDDPNFDDAMFIRTLIETCVIEPANIDVSRLKPLVYTLLSAEIQASFGLTEVVQKNLEKRFGLSPDSTP